MNGCVAFDFVFFFSHHLYTAFLWSKSFLPLNTPTTSLFLSDLNFLYSHFCRHRNPDRGKNNQAAWQVADARDLENIPSKEATPVLLLLINTF